MSHFRDCDDDHHFKCCCGPAGPRGPRGCPGPTGPTGAYIIGKQTTCKNAVPLNRVLMGIDLDVFSYSAVLISEF